MDRHSAYFSGSQSLMEEIDVSQEKITEYFEVMKGYYVQSAMEKERRNNST